LLLEPKRGWAGKTAKNKASGKIESNLERGFTSNILASEPAERLQLSMARHLRCRAGCRFIPRSGAQWHQEQNPMKNITVSVTDETLHTPSLLHRKKLRAPCTPLYRESPRTGLDPRGGRRNGWDTAKPVQTSRERLPHRRWSTVVHYLLESWSASERAAKSFRAAKLSTQTRPTAPESNKKRLHLPYNSQQESQYKHMKTNILCKKARTFSLPHPVNRRFSIVKS